MRLPGRSTWKFHSTTSATTTAVSPTAPARQQRSCISPGRAFKAVRDLKERGFIVPQREGHFDRKTRHATEWRLTEYPCNVTDALPTKDFAKWQPPNNKVISIAVPGREKARLVANAFATHGSPP
jgi:hypothetical protein